MTVGQARHETAGRPLSDVTGREDDPFRIIVAETEDGVGKIKGERRVYVKRRQVELFRLDDRPVAAVDLDVGIAGVDDAGRDFLSFVKRPSRT
jgi:hypothetical protein